MRILIIGGTGLISNSITRQLVSSGHTVTHYNRSQTPGLGPVVPTIPGDRRDHTRFAQQIRESGVWDAVIDMVCYQPDDARSLLECFRGSTAHLLVCSTIDVYAKPASRYPIREDERHGPLNEYGRNKSICEHILLEAGYPDLPVTVIRPAHTYGPGSAHRGHVVHTFGGRTTLLDRLEKGKPIIVHGDGNSFWTSSYTDDVANAFTGAIGNSRTFGKAYHATSDEWLTWNRYYALVAEALEAPPPDLVHIPTEVLTAALPNRSTIIRENFQFNNIFDNSAARDDLGYRQAMGFLDGMRRTLGWVRETGGFEDCASEPWYDELVEAWNRSRGRFQEAAAGLDA